MSFIARSCCSRRLTHRSLGATHNERLEFIGDAVLNCVIAMPLFQRFPDMPEGELSRLRASLVNKDTLFRLAQGLDLGRSLRLGEGEAAQRRHVAAVDPGRLRWKRCSVRCSSMAVSTRHAPRSSAVYAAELARTRSSRHSPRIRRLRLQEWLQARRLPVPEYAIVAVTGEAHVQSFDVECRIRCAWHRGRRIGMPVAARPSRPPQRKPMSKRPRAEGGTRATTAPFAAARSPSSDGPTSANRRWSMRSSARASASRRARRRPRGIGCSAS